MLTVCFILMAVCLGAEGFLLLLSGFPFPGLDPRLYIVGVIWTLTCIAVLLFMKKPSFTVALGWVLFIVNAGDMWFHSKEERSIAWFMYQHSLELAFIVFSHVGYFLVTRRDKRT